MAAGRLLEFESRRPSSSPSVLELLAAEYGEQVGALLGCCCRCCCCCWALASASASASACSCCHTCSTVIARNVACSHVAWQATSVQPYSHMVLLPHWSAINSCRSLWTL